MLLLGQEGFGFRPVESAGLQVDGGLDRETSAEPFGGTFSRLRKDNDETAGVSR